MNTDKQRLRELLANYASDNLTEAERLFLRQCMDDPAISPVIPELLEESFMAAEYDDEEPAERAGRLSLLLRQRIHPVRRKFVNRYYWAAAAAIVLLLSAGAWFLASRETQEAAKIAGTPETIIQPGRNGAILTLADGSEIVLDSLRNGLVAKQAGAQVTLANGQLQYNASGSATDAMQYNTISTPKGRQFRLLLPDGSAIWLNAASTVRYPVVFSATERHVSISGEAYFEIAKDPQRPFTVSVNDRQQISVLGTSFNVNAYIDESQIQTTLLQGSIRLKTAARTILLQPGQQAQQSSDGAVTVQPDVDSDRVMAWKNGAFNFNDLSLEAAMRILERWYDITVVYENGVPDVRFGGEIDRNVNLDELLKILGRTKLKFRIEDGRTLVISK